MLQKLFLSVLLMTWLSGISIAKSFDSWSPNYELRSAAVPHFDATSFDYDYRIEPRRASTSKYRRARPTTTERPLVRYWNNFMRNVRLSIPTITWNVTNPLANFFNAEGESNVLETPVADYYTSNEQRKRRRKNSNKKLKRSQKRKNRHDFDDYNDFDAYKQQEFVLPAYAASDDNGNYDPHQTIYFYNANANKYYELHPSAASTNSAYENDDFYDEAHVKPHEQTSTSSSAAVLNNQLEADESVANESVEEKLEPNDKDIEDVAVVTKLDYDDDDEDGVSKNDKENDDESNPKEHHEITVDHSNKKTEETLRNVLGSYMSSDRYTRKRQRVNSASTKVKKLGKQRPRDTFRYYFIGYN